MKAAVSHDNARFYSVYTNYLGGGLAGLSTLSILYPIESLAKIMATESFAAKDANKTVLFAQSFKYI